jgi:hypothetical protein
MLREYKYVIKNRSAYSMGPIKKGYNAIINKQKNLKVGDHVGCLKKMIYMAMRPKTM